MGHSRGGLTTKIHALVDAEGPIRLKLTPGQAGDAPVGTEFVADLDPGSTLIADRAYDTNPIREGAAALGVWANIPPRVIRKDALFQPVGLSPEEPGRALLQPHQTVPRPRNSMRPQAGKLPRRPQTRSNPLLDCKLMSPRPR